MADNNRLELVISLRDDSSAGAQSIKTRFKSLENDAREMSLTFDKAINNLTASSQRSLDAFVRRASLVGKTGEEKIYAQANILKDKIGSDDQAVRAQIDQGTNQLVAAYKRRQAEVNRAREAADTKRQGTLAGQATLAGEAEFQTAFKRVQQRDQMMRDLEQRASLAGKKTSERLAMEGARVVSGLASTPKLAQEAEAHYKTIVDAAKKAEAEAGGHSAGSQALRRGGLAVKDALEGSSRGFWIELTDIFIGTSGSGGILPHMATGLAEITGISTGAVYAIGGLTLGFLALGAAGAMSVKSLAETGQQIKDFSIRTGIKPENVQAFQFAARAEGADPNIFEHASRSLAQALNDDSASGKKVKKELKDLGVGSLYNDVGELRPTEDVFLSISDALNKMPESLKQSAATLELFKRLGPEFLPVLLALRENKNQSDVIGNTLTKPQLDMMDEWHKQINIMEEEWRRFKIQVEIPLAVTFIKTVTFAKKATDIPLGVIAASEELVRQNISGLFVGYDVNDVPGRPPSYNEKGDYIGAPNAGRAQKLIERGNVDADIAAFKKQQLKDPRVALQQAERDLAALPVPEEHVSTPKQFAEYKAAFDRVETLRRRADPEANRGLQDVIAARQEGLNLDAQIAKQRVTDQAEILRAGMGSKSGLASQQDIEEELRLAGLAAHAETVSEINKRQFRIDPKTGRKIDESNEPGFRDFKRIQEQELEPKRVQEEYEKILTRMLVDSAKFYRTRTDESMKHYEEEWQRRQSRELEIQGEINKIGNEISDRRTQFDIDANERAKNIAIESLGAVNKQTLKDKMSLEDQKLAIEKDYADRGLALQLQRINTERARAVADIEKKDRDQGIDPNTDPNTQELIRLTNEKYGQDADAARAVNSDKELSDAMKTAKAKEDLQIQSNRKIYDSLKQDAAGLFDQLVSHTKSWADFAKDLFKSAILTPVKDIFSSQVAGLFTGLITGNKVTFDPVGTGEGKLGKLGSLFGRAGGGEPNFHVPKSTPFITSKLEQTVEGNAVRVLVVNSAQVGQAHAQATASYPGVGPVAAFASSLGAGFHAPLKAVAASLESVSSTLIGGIDETNTGAPLTGVPYDGSLRNSLWNKALSQSLGLSPNGFETMGDVAGLGTPSGLFGADNQFAVPTAPPFDSGLSGVQLADWANPNLGPEAGMATPASGGGFLSRLGGMFGLGNPADVHGTPPFVASGDGSPGSASTPAPAKGGGLLSMLGHSLMGGIGKLFKRGDGTAGSDTGETDDETGLALGHGIPGSEEGSDEGSGEGSDSKGVSGPLGGLLVAGGTALAADGWHRGGGKGALEMAAGGAAIGYKYGGPLGAAVGGLAGLEIGVIKWAFFQSDRDHAKELVKQVYGMDINNGTADSIIQIAKQSFGNQIDVAVRSPQVRELLKLYSQATGQKKAEDQFVQSDIHGASLVESNGKLMQQAIYDNGNAYSYSSQLGNYQGVQTSPLSTYAPNNGVFSGSVQINLNGQSAADVLEGRVTNVVTPGFVQGKSLAASNASIGRASQTRMTLAPSAIPG